MTAAVLDLDVPLRLHPLTYLDEGDEVTVGRSDIDSYGLFPPDAAKLLRRLEAGHTPNDSARWYEQQYGEQVDIADFVQILGEYELLIKDGEELPATPAIRWQRLGQALFSPVALLGYTGVVMAALVLMAADHAVVPRYQNLFFTRGSLVLLSLGIVIGQIPWILLHEAYHALAGRRLGLNSSLRIGRRFYYLVFLTSMDGLVAVPRRRRYLPMLAGMMIDAVVAAALTLAAAPLLTSSGGPLLLGKYLLTMAFGALLRLAWQFYFFLRTDLYYTVTTVMGCHDLQTVARQQLQNRWYRLTGHDERLIDPQTWSPKDAGIARWYSWLMLAGYGVMGGTLVFIGIPTIVNLARLAFVRLGPDRTPLGIADVIGFVVLNLWEIVATGVLALRDYRRRARRPVTA